MARCALPVCLDKHNTNPLGSMLSMKLASQHVTFKMVVAIYQTLHLVRLNQWKIPAEKALLNLRPPRVDRNQIYQQKLIIPLLLQETL